MAECENSHTEDASDPSDSAKYWIQQLKLQSHPFMAGGYFRETFKDDVQVQVKGKSSANGTFGIEDFAT